jgi:hypothetical protein
VPRMTKRKAMMVKSSAIEDKLRRCRGMPAGLFYATNGCSNPGSPYK